MAWLGAVQTDGVVDESNLAGASEKSVTGAVANRDALISASGPEGPESERSLEDKLSKSILDTPRRENYAAPAPESEVAANTRLASGYQLPGQRKRGR